MGDDFYVVGLNLVQALAYVKKIGGTPMLAPEKLRGLLPGTKIQPVGGFYMRRDWYEWELECRKRRLILLPGIMEIPA